MKEMTLLENITETTQHILKIQWMSLLLKYIKLIFGVVYLMCVHIVGLLKVNHCSTATHQMRH